MARPVCDLPEPDSPDDPEPLAAELERHAAHRFDNAGAQMEADAQVFDFEKRLGSFGGLRIEHVAQAVAEQVEAEADHEDGERPAWRRPTIGR